MVELCPACSGQGTVASKIDLLRSLLDEVELVLEEKYFWQQPNKNGTYLEVRLKSENRLIHGHMKSCSGELIKEFQLSRQYVINQGED